MKEFLYYPGCSLKGTGGPYEQSLLSTFGKLGLKLIEIPDWNCCGATAYMSVDEDMALILGARNLALAEKSDGRDIVAPCSGCFLSLRKTKETLAKYPNEHVKVANALAKANLSYSGRCNVRHPLEVLMTELGGSGIRSAVARPLKNFKVVPYYGCAILRPFDAMGNSHLPTMLEGLIQATGATPVEYPYKGRCCGGMLSSGVQTVGLRLAEILLEAAAKTEADAIVTTCPLCQYNLECYQKRLMKMTGKDLEMPVFYFTQMLGLAMGIGERELGVDRLLRKPAIAGVIA